MSAGSRYQTDPYDRDLDELGGRVAIALDNRRDQRGTPHFHPVPAIGAFPPVAGCYACEHARVPAISPDVELVHVRSKLDKLTHVRRRSPLVGNAAADHERLCDSEQNLLRKPVAAP